jgi:uncharacterized protein (TIGR02996 family)
MFALVVHERERSAWRRAFATHDITIGADAGNDLVLDAAAGVDARHGRLVRQAGHYILVDFETTAGTFVNGRKIVAPQVVRERDIVMVGDVRLELVTLGYEEIGTAALAPRAPLEHELLEAIGHGDEASRLVYADWLEALGDRERAEVVRLQQALDRERDPVLRERGRDRLRELVADLDLPSRARLVKVPIENCAPTFRFQCPKLWSELLLTAVEGERHCGACDRTVYYCATIDEARKRAAERACVAIDLASPRWDGDLDAPFGERMCIPCDLDVGHGLRACPRCGEPVHVETMLLGEIA